MSHKNEALKRQIIRLYKLGFGPKDIADELETTRDMVNGIVVRAGIYEPKKGQIKYDYKIKRSIKYWADVYGIPPGSCYEVFRKQGLGDLKRDGVGSPKLLTEREFLSGAVFTRLGRKVISRLFQKGIILTAKEVRDSIHSKD